MGDQNNNEVFRRFGPGLLLRRQPPGQQQAADTGAARQGDEGVPPPDLEPLRARVREQLSPWRPEFIRSGAWDSSKIGQIEVTNKRTGKTVPRDLTLGQVPNILFNEYRSLQGSGPKHSKHQYAGDEQLRKAKSDTAYAIFNDARYAPTRVAPAVVNRRARQSPEYARDFKDYQNTVWNAFAGYMMGQDPVEGRGKYNFRPNNSTAPRSVPTRRGLRVDPQQTVYRHFGRFYDRNQRRDSWFNIYNPPLNPAYAQPKPTKGQR